MEGSDGRCKTGYPFEIYRPRNLIRPPGANAPTSVKVEILTLWGGAKGTRSIGTQKKEMQKNGPAEEESRCSEFWGKRLPKSGQCEQGNLKNFSLPQPVWTEGKRRIRRDKGNEKFDTLKLSIDKAPSSVGGGTEVKRRPAC